MLVRITTTETGQTFEDQFTITIKDQCRDIILTSGITVKALDSSVKTETDPFQWHMWQFAQAMFAPIATTPSGCPVTYTLTDTDSDRTQISASVMIIDQSNPTLFQI